MTTDPVPPPVPEALDEDGHLTVFAYGSLIWKPGFPHLSAHPALLRGYHRRFCIWSHQYRGTKESPGLVLGLDRGGACRGVAFRVAADRAAEVMAYLDEREMSGGVYHRRLLPVRLLDTGQTRRAVAFVADRQGDQYCAGLAPDAAAAVIARGAGVMGANRDYLLNTVSHLRDLGVRDAGLERIAALLPWSSPDSSTSRTAPADAAPDVSTGYPQGAEPGEGAGLKSLIGKVDFHPQPRTPVDKP